MSGYENKGGNPLGTAGFVLSIIGFLLWPLLIIGLVLSIIGLVKAKNEGLPKSLSKAGLIIAIIGVLLYIASLVLFMSLLPTEPY